MQVSTSVLLCHCQQHQKGAPQQAKQASHPPPGPQEAATNTSKVLVSHHKTIPARCKGFLWPLAFWLFCMMSKSSLEKALFSD